MPFKCLTVQQPHKVTGSAVNPMDSLHEANSTRFGYAHARTPLAASLGRDQSLIRSGFQLNFCRAPSPEWFSVGRECRQITSDSCKRQTEVLVLRSTVILRLVLNFRTFLGVAFVDKPQTRECNYRVAQTEK